MSGEYLSFYNIAATLANRSSLVVDFGPQYGIWMRRGTNWTRVHQLTAEGIIRFDEGDNDGLVIDFGAGVGVWGWLSDGVDAFWFQINTAAATAMVAVDLDGDGEDEAGVLSFRAPVCGSLTETAASGLTYIRSLPRTWPPPISTVTAGRM